MNQCRSIDCNKHRPRWWVLVAGKAMHGGGRQDAGKTCSLFSVLLETTICSKIAIIFLWKGMIHNHRIQCVILLMNTQGSQWWCSLGFCFCWENRLEEAVSCFSGDISDVLLLYLIDNMHLVNIDRDLCSWCHFWVYNLSQYLNVLL